MASTSGGKPRSLLPRFPVLLLVSFLIFVGIHQTDSSKESEIINKWAEKFGEELWDLGKRITKAPDIKARYKALHVRVEYKDGPSLLRSAVETVGRMLSRKMDAIKCILEVAELNAEQYDYNETADGNLTYYSAKFSSVNGNPAPELPSKLVNNSWMYRDMYFNSDTHFYNISVNTSYSSVHVPTNVFDRGVEVQETIAWSEYLDDVFIQNYNSDPALSWQYFGSSTGILRQYPALAWDRKTTNVDLFDCRTRSWFIEAATCSKDVVILFDNSGSMWGYRNFVATFTVKALLETFSNNDFVNIFSFANDTYETVPCFANMLVQATPDNIRTFNEALLKLKPDGNSNFTLAFERAFQLLEYYREQRGCNASVVGCNQAIMVVTDGVPGNLTQVFETYNWFDNGTNIPVRIFTYLIGKEVTNVREIQWMACLNRGYYVHIQSLDEVQEKVLKYISVIARPLVLQEVDHPISWTHAYTDITDKKVGMWLWNVAESQKQRQRVYDRIRRVDSSRNDDSKYKDKSTYSGRYEEYRLMTAAAIPLYDRKVNKMNDTRTANLLGVAGTDVPIEDIDKLTLPYKLGVNGYSFIVSNNGYLLLHPDLRPVYKGILKENYNSVDLVEVEMIDEDLGIRQLGSKLLKLREAMVGNSEGSMLNVSVRFHYDKMKRIALGVHDYYFAPLPKTPFSLGIVLPHEYGTTWIKVTDEIKNNQQLDLKLEDFFKGDNWKIHPKWVYCKYHYLEWHKFDTPEAELLHFLQKMESSDWKWSQQYEEFESSDNFQNGEPQLNCGRKTLDDDAYYCNKELVQLLVFDAKVTDPAYNTWSFADKAEERLFIKYNASLRFAATSSGLTRWQFVFGEDVNNTDSEFGDYHTEAIDESWYRSAVMQHHVDTESFVFSVEYKAGAKNPADVLVTASHALFPLDGGLQAPAAVLGYQISHHLMLENFMEATSVDENCDDCLKACSSDEQECYILDSSGYIILSKNHNDTGKFFGEIEGPVMERMVEADIYHKVTIYDFQGVCFKQVIKNSAANILLTPFKLLALGIRWTIGQMAWLLIRSGLPFVWDSPLVHSLSIDDDEYYDEYEDMELEGGGTPPPKPTPPPRKMRKGLDIEEEEFFSKPKEIIWVTDNYPCDRKGDLFFLQQKKLMSGDDFHASGPTNSSRPFFSKKIPYSNLLMVVVNRMYPSSGMRMHAGARPVVYEPGATTPPCHKLDLAGLPRRRLEGCYTDHPLEHEVEACGRSGGLQLSILVLVLCWLFLAGKKLIV